MSAVKTHPVLAELLARAVASSDDRPKWLAARARGVTATEVAKLAKAGRQSAYWRGLVKEKLSGVEQPDISGSMYIRHGQVREAHIAAWGEQRFGIAPNHWLFHAVDNDRFLATPDGIGVDFGDELVLEEDKTSKYDLTPEDPESHYSATDYADQKQWQMSVTGGRRVLFAWEQHDNDWSGWPDRSPAPLHAEPKYRWIDRDEDRIAFLVEVATQFLEDLDAGLDGTEAGVDEYLDTLAVNVLTFREQESSAKAAKQKAWDELLNILETDQPYSQESILARITYSPGQASTSEVLDAEAAKAADPELFAEVQSLSKRWNEHAAKFKKTVPTTSKPTLTVTSVKQTKEKKS